MIHIGRDLGFPFCAMKLSSFIFIISWNQQLSLSVNVMPLSVLDQLQ